MRLKHVPEPPVSPNDETSEPGTGEGGSDSEPSEPASVQLAVDAVADAHGAVPLVPGSEDDCCARLQRRVGYPSRDVARTWLTFLRGLGYAEETDRGFRRTRREPTADGVRRGLLDGIVGARELADALLLADTRATDTSDADDTDLPGDGDPPDDTGPTDDADSLDDTDLTEDGDPADDGDSLDGDRPATPGGGRAGIDADEAFAAVREAVPRWERTRTDDWETVWRERTDRLLGWFHALGLAERDDATDRVRATPILATLRRER